jgi:hypothetical protein
MRRFRKNWFEPEDFNVEEERFLLILKILLFGGYAVWSLPACKGISWMSEAEG